MTCVNRGVFLIAEAGVNHNGSLEVALKMVDAAAEAGADAVKFQTFISSRLVSAIAPKARYQTENMPGSGTSQLEMLRRLELRFDDFVVLRYRCAQKGIRFMTTPFDCESADFSDSLVDIFKIGSGDLDNIPFIKHIAGKKKPVILSTGMGELDEVKVAVDNLLAILPPAMPGGFPPLTLLQCVTEYPCPYEHANLRGMLTLRERFGVPVGYSDHTSGVDAALAAAALGASVIEKHFTLDKSFDGPDHRASLEPAELARMVEGVRNVEKALGDGVKTPTDAEIETRRVARKVVVAATLIAAGEVLSPLNTTLKRAGQGIPASKWDEIIGRRARRDFAPDEPIEL